jgi:SNF2 family DNA or RNA helicase
VTPEPVLATTDQALLALPTARVASVTRPALPPAQTLRLPVTPLPVNITSVPLLAQPVAVFSHRFGGDDRPPVPQRECPGTTNDRPAGQRPASRTRIQPPQDVVKLSERLFYLLQPDLETLLAGCRIGFPHQPFPFQFDGMAFLLPRVSGILADEMGLGKSMQAISSLRLLIRSGQARRVLVVCPKGLVSNWARELSVWAPEIVVAVIEGSPDRRRWQWSLPDVPVKIANYESVVRDRDLVAELGLSFDLVVLDEAQRIKNRSSQTSEAVCGLSRGRSWALTGTPVENRSEDLVGIFEFVAPGHVHDKMSPRALGAAAADYVLRRTKDKVLDDMPPRLDRDQLIELTPDQRETYRRAEEEGVLRLSDMGQEATIQHVFELVLRLKQICNFDTATGSSAKLDCLAAELEEVQASGRKALVFSQWVETLGRLRERLGRFGPLEYHGGMSTAARDAAIDRFRHDKQHSVLLLSYGAGAVGLNLQFSQYVFLFDRWWNPAIEDQAINRAHRIGAAGAVTVTKFLSVGTIEERIDEVLDRKRNLSDVILSQAEPAAGSGMSADDIFSLFGLAAPLQSTRRAA